MTNRSKRVWKVHSSTETNRKIRRVRTRAREGRRKKSTHRKNKSKQERLVSLSYPSCFRFLPLDSINSSSGHNTKNDLDQIKFVQSHCIDCSHCAEVAKEKNHRMQQQFICIAQATITNQLFKCLDDVFLTELVQPQNASQRLFLLRDKQFKGLRNARSCVRSVNVCVFVVSFFCLFLFICPCTTISLRSKISNSYIYSVLCFF